MPIATNERGHVVKRSSKPAIRTMLASLRRGNAPTWSWSGWTRSGPVVGTSRSCTYQLEYRDGVAELHYQTQTISQEKVFGALLGWAGAKSGWRDGFMWNNVAEQFGPSEREA